MLKKHNNLLQYTILYNIMEEINVKFNVNEAQVLIQLLDIAVRAQGLNAAEAGVILSRKIQQEFQAAGGDASILNPNSGSNGAQGSDGGGGSGPSGPENTEVNFSSFSSGPESDPNKHAPAEGSCVK